MANLAQTLRQVGYVTPQGQVTGPNAPLAQQLKNYVTNVIPTAAQNLAQQRADIDAALTMGQGGVEVGDKAAFERALEQVPFMGATIPIYHSTTKEAAENIGKRGFDKNKSYDTTAWFTTSSNPMETGASGQGAVIKRLIDEDKLKLASMEDVDKYFIDQLISQGYQGVKYPQRGLKGDETYYQMFYPNKLGKEKPLRKEVLEQNFNKIAGGEKPVRSAVVMIGDKIFTGNTHGQALLKAVDEGVVRKEGGKYIYPKNAEINNDLFMLNNGRIVDRLEASRMLDVPASESAIAQNKMQFRPANSMNVDEYMRQAKIIKESQK